MFCMEKLCVFFGMRTSMNFGKKFAKTRTGAAQTLRRKGSTQRLVHLRYLRRQTGDFSRGGNLFLQDQNLETFRRGRFKILTPIEFIMSKIHQARVHVFSHFFVRERTR